MKLTNKKNTLILIGIILISILQLSMFIPFVQDKTTAIYCPKVFPLNDADKEWVENTLQKASADA